MQTTSIQLIIPPPAAEFSLLKQRLRLVHGVNIVTCSDDGREIAMRFDERLTSVQALQDVVQRAGYQLAPKQSNHGSDGVCCGSCSG